MCYALEEFSRLGKLPDFLTCTDKLQEWNRPRPKKLAVIPVANLTARRSNILQRESKGSSLSNFNPRQPHHRTIDSEAVENLRYDLLSLSEPCAILDILVPSAKKIKHDHSYTLPPGGEEREATCANVDSDLVEADLDVPHSSMHIDELKAACATVKSALTNIPCSQVE